jgi:hypothetical protein
MKTNLKSLLSNPDMNDPKFTIHRKPVSLEYKQYASLVQSFRK